MNKNIKSGGALVKQLGLSLVELMVAVLIGLIILAGVVQVLVSSKSTFLAQEDVAFIQENARYAMDVIGRDLRNAGSMGCAGANKDFAFVPTINNAAEDLLIGEFAVETSADITDQLATADIRPVTGVSGSDLPEGLIVRSADGLPRALTLDQNGTLFTLNSVQGISNGQLIAVVGEDCRRAAVVKAITVDANNSTINFNNGACTSAIKLALGSSVSCQANCACTGDSGGVARTFKTGATITPYSVRGYFVADSGVLPGQPALKRQVIRNNQIEVEEIALGVEDMEFIYVVENGSTEYLTSAEMLASTDSQIWAKVSAVEVHMLMRSSGETSVSADAKTYLGNSYSDKYVRRVVSSTFKLRNPG